MDEITYRLKLYEAMRVCTEDAVKNIQGAIANWPEKATTFGFDTFIDQDGEGFVSILITPDGPDSYVLNRKIKEFRHIFDVKFVDGKLNHSLPLFDPDEIQFDISRVVSETALEWIKGLIEKVGKSSFPVPIRFSDCDHVSINPLHLST